MNPIHRADPRWVGVSTVGLIVAGFGVLLVWIWNAPAGAVQWLPQADRVSLNTSLLLTLAGASLLALPHVGAPDKRWRWAAMALGSMLVFFPALIASQSLFGTNLGIDFARPGARASALFPHPGRLAPNTSAALMCMGISVLALAWRRNGAVQRRLARLSWAGLALVAVSGLLGHLLGIEQLYRVPAFNQMLLPTAAALTVLAMGLGMHLGALSEDNLSDSPAAMERKILYRALGTLTTVVLCAGVAGFISVRTTFEESVKGNLLQDVRTHSIAFADTLNTSLRFSDLIAHRPRLVESLQVLDRQPGADPALQDIRVLVGGLARSGTQGVRVLGQQREVLGEAGSFLKAPQSSNALKSSPASSTATLLWSGRYLLRTEVPVEAEGRVLGYVETEQALPLLDEMLADLRSASESSDALLCSSTGQDAACAPTRFYREPLRIPMYDSDGKANLPINRALLGEQGVVVARDLRNIEVMAAFGPIGDHGLGLVIKIDATTLYAPLRQRLVWALLVVLALVGVGTAAVVGRVHPLVRRVVDQRTQLKTILDTSTDAFVSLDAQGLVTAWNQQAAAMFGWDEREALGQPVQALIVPHVHRAHTGGFERFAWPDQEHTQDRRIEAVLMHRDGREFTAELSISVMENAAGAVANAFIRDVSERKEAQRRLAASEKLLQGVTDNLPALVSYVDREHRFAFSNGQYREWYGLAPSDLMGKHLRDVLGAQTYGSIEPQLAAAFQGQVVSYERESFERGMNRHLMVTYSPDQNAAGEVLGCYAMVMDITERKQAELKVAESERRLADVTNSIPAMVGYFDRNERCLFANDAGLRSQGLAQGDLANLDLREALGELNYEQHAPYVRQALQGTRTSFEGTIPFRGKTAYFQAHLLPSKDMAGDVIGFYLMTFDITPLKQAQLKQEAGERQLRAITENLPVMISYIDKEQRLQFLNRTFEAWTGLSRDLALGRTLKEVIGDALYGQRQEALERALAGERIQFEAVSTTAGVTRTLQTIYVPDMVSLSETVGVFTLTSDVTSLHEAEQAMARLARVDSLTGLPNRRAFQEGLPLALARAKRNQTGTALMFLDVDHFKSINDTRGHAAGDAVLMEFARRLLASVRATDMVARLAGDEFVVILEGIKAPQEAELIAAKICEVFTAPVRLPSGEVPVSTSIGIAFLPVGSGAEVEALLATADHALYATKKNGRRGYSVQVHEEPAAPA